jgi:hypothetical protein
MEKYWHEIRDKQWRLKGQKQCKNENKDMWSDEINITGQNTGLQNKH